jgi:1-aminocyclopropane-1-carboxylate deaminase/D-cysteine desulfhydrase-like pyridoxal-dependent ACC family enzyme
VIGDPDALTPVERVGGWWVKRDDAFEVAGSCGGKVRTCLHIARAAQAAGRRTLVTAGSRSSPQVNIVAGVAAALGMHARCHVPTGQWTPEMLAAGRAGAHIIRHRPGHNSVLVARAREDAAADRSAELVPFGMETPLAVTYTAAQCANLPYGDFGRLVVSVGSGMSLAGIIAGLTDNTGMGAVPVLGVRVGADPIARLDHYAPMWRWCDVTLAAAGLAYHQPLHRVLVNDRGFPIVLDPIYEAKCHPLLQPGDLLWIVGRRQTVTEAVPV